MIPIFKMKCISRVSDQNGISRLYIIVELRHSGRKPLIFNQLNTFSHWASIAAWLFACLLLWWQLFVSAHSETSTGLEEGQSIVLKSDVFKVVYFMFYHFKFYYW